MFNLTGMNAGCSKLLELRHALALSGEMAANADCTLTQIAGAPRARSSPSWAQRRTVPKLGLTTPTAGSVVPLAVGESGQQAGCLDEPSQKERSTFGSQGLQYSLQDSWAPSCRMEAPQSHTRPKRWGDLGGGLACRTANHSFASSSSSGVAMASRVGKDEDGLLLHHSSTNELLSMASTTRGVGHSRGMGQCLPDPQSTGADVLESSHLPMQSALGGSFRRSATPRVAKGMAASEVSKATQLSSSPRRQLRTARNSRAATASETGSNMVAELEALKHVCLGEDEQLIQQLSSPRRGTGSGGGHRGVAIGTEVASKRPLPAVPKVAEVPPSLRAWRRQRQISDRHDELAGATGGGQEEQKVQVARMKASLQELTSEVKQLQDLMELDALELADNVREIRQELHLARGRRRQTGTPATTAGPSPASSRASTTPSTPISHRVFGGAPFDLRAINSARMIQAAAGRVGEAPLQRPILAMQPLARNTLSSLSASAKAIGDWTGPAANLASTLAMPRFACLLADFAASADSLKLGTVCRASARACHTDDGRRIWPHVSVEARGCQPADIVRALRGAVDWPTVRSISFFGVTDAEVETLCSVLNFGAWSNRIGDARATKTAPISGLSALRFSCSSKGSAGAIEKRNRFGDHMGLGDAGFRLLAPSLADPILTRRLRCLDLSWNHLGDNSVYLLGRSWPNTLSALRLDWNEIGAAGAQHLAAATKQCSAAALEALDLRSNPLGDTGVMSICQSVAAHAGLKWLGLGEVLLTDIGATSSLQLLCQHPTLTGLDVGENTLTDASCGVLAELVAHAPALTTLLLRGFLFEQVRIGDEGGQLLARALVHRCQSFRPICCGGKFSLELDYQQLGCGTARELARCPPAVWKRLSLFNTEVSDMGALALANAFRAQPGSASVTHMNMAQCRLGAGTVRFLRTVGFRRLDSHGQRGPPRSKTEA